MAKDKDKKDQPVESSSTTLAPVEDTPKAVAAFDFAALAADASANKQAFEKEDVAIPFLRVAQGLSPQTKPHEASYIEGLKEGDIFNTVTGQIFRGADNKTPELIVVPVLYSRNYLEFWPRDSKEGTGLVADHGTNAAVLEGTTEDEKRRNITARGTEIVKTAMYYVLQIDPVSGRPTPSALALTRTQLKHARRWNSLMSALTVTNPADETQTIVPPIYYQAYRIGTTPERKDNYTWMGLRIDMLRPTHELPNGAAIYHAAKELLAMVKSGAVSAKVGEELGAQTKESDNAEDVDLPF